MGGGVGGGIHFLQLTHIGWGSVNGTYVRVRVGGSFGSPFGPNSILKSSNMHGHWDKRSGFGGISINWTMQNRRTMNLKYYTYKYSSRGIKS